MQFYFHWLLTFQTPCIYYKKKNVETCNKIQMAIQKHRLNFDTQKSSPCSSTATTEQFFSNNRDKNLLSQTYSQQFIMPMPLFHSNIYHLFCTVILTKLDYLHSLALIFTSKQRKRKDVFLRKEYMKQQGQYKYLSQCNFWV